MINIWSIPHTGTHFLKHLLENAGIECKARHFSGWELTDDLVIAPIRDPKKTLQSWIARGREQDFNEMWQIFDTAFQTQNMFILPIDTQCRDKELIELSKILGVELKTDWEPLNKGISNNDETGDLSSIYNLSVVKKYYSTKVKRKRRTKAEMAANDQTESKG